MFNLGGQRAIGLPPRELPDKGNWLLVIGYWLLVIRYWLLVIFF